MHTYTEATARWLRKHKKYIQKNYQVIQCGDDVIVRSTGKQKGKEMRPIRLDTPTIIGYTTF